MSDWKPAEVDHVRADLATLEAELAKGLRARAEQRGLTVRTWVGGVTWYDELLTECDGTNCEEACCHESNGHGASCIITSGDRSMIITFQDVEGYRMVALHEPDGPMPPELEFVMPTVEAVASIGDDELDMLRDGCTPVLCWEALADRVSAGKCDSAAHGSRCDTCGELTPGERRNESWDYCECGTEPLIEHEGVAK